MIAVDVREKNLFDLCAQGLGLLDNAIEIRVRAERYVDDDDVLSSNDVLIGSLERHVTGIVSGELSYICRRCHNGPFSSFQVYNDRTVHSGKKSQRCLAKQHQRFSSSHEQR